MTLLQIIMLAGSAYFAFKIYEHIQTLQDPQDDNQNNNYNSGSSYEEVDENKSAEAFSPFSADELVDKADEAFQEGEPQKALSFLHEADVKAPNNAEILFKLGFISASVGDNMAAIDYYKKSLDVDKNDEFVHNSLASVYRAEKEFASAKMHLNDSLEIDDENPGTYFNYGNLMVDMGNKDVAIEMYKKAIEIDPDFSQAKEELSKLEAK